MFELLVKSGGEERRVSMTPFLPAEISDTYLGKFGEVSLTIMPHIKAEDPWETVVDLSLDQAAMLRDALSMMIEHLKRNPATD